MVDSRNTTTSSLTIKSLLVMYLEAQLGKRIRPSTAYLLDRSVRWFIELAGDIKIIDVTIDVIEMLQEYLYSSKKSTTTVNWYVRTMAPMFAWAKKRQMIERNPFLEVQRYKEVKKPVRAYSIDELGRLLAAADPLWQIIIMLGLSTLRKSEVLNLTWDDIDFEQGFIKVQPKFKTFDTWEWQIKDTDLRFVPLLSMVATILKVRKSQLPPEHPYVVIEPERYEYLMSKKGELNYRMRVEPINNFNRKFTKLRENARVTGDFHQLRKTGITELTKFLRLQDVKDIAGHSNIKTTEAYMAKSDNLLVQAKGVFDRNFETLALTV